MGGNLGYGRDVLVRGTIRCRTFKSLRASRSPCLLSRVRAVSRHRSLMPLVDAAPSVAGDAWVAPSASLIGKVDVSSKASVWYGAVVKGERRWQGLAVSAARTEAWIFVEDMGSHLVLVRLANERSRGDRFTRQRTRIHGSKGTWRITWGLGTRVNVCPCPWRRRDVMSSAAVADALDWYGVRRPASLFCQLRADGVRLG